MGKMTYRKRKVVLNFKEDKPEVYKIAQITLPQVSYPDLLEEISHAENVNETVTQAVITALLNRLTHYMAYGHGVSLGSFGSFKPSFRSICTQTLEDANANTIKQKIIRFYPGKKLREMIQEVEIADAKALDISE
ncbi:MAG: HU family DNA-binding protein [Prevotellaceae bacterium]|nr:HU family DNA-binding protein [Candidatus Minthosoma caballi]